MSTAVIQNKEEPEKLPDLIEYAIFNIDKMQEMDNRGAQDVAKRFTKDITANNILAVYKRILGE